MRIGRRMVVRGSVPGLNEFTIGGRDTFQHVGNLSKHTHKGAFEFCLILHGRVTWLVRGALRVVSRR